MPINYELFVEGDGIYLYILITLSLLHYPSAELHRSMWGETKIVLQIW